MTAVWTLGAEADAQRLYEQQENWEEGTGAHFFEEVLSSVQLLEVFPEMGLSFIEATSGRCWFSNVISVCSMWWNRAGSSFMPCLI